MTAIDYQAATHFLRLLDPSSKKFVLQTFDDKKKGQDSDPRLARSGPSRAVLLALYERGAGVWVTGNKSDDSGRRKSENIERIRAMWQEDDAGYDGLFPLEPSIVVESSPGKRHRYWLVADGWPADSAGRADFAVVMERMVTTYGSDKNAKDISRVLRLPGFLHRKDPTRPHMVRIVEASGRRYAREEILRAFPPVELEKPAPRCANSRINSASVLERRGFRADSSCDEQRVIEALRFVPADEYFMWLRLGMALKDALGERGRPIWDSWSQTSDKFNDRDQEKTWRAFRRHGITIGTLFHYAKQNGWRSSPTELQLETCRAASRCIRRETPATALRTFLQWADYRGVERSAAMRVFEKILDKELAK